MKRFKKVFLGIALAFVTLIALASCSNVSKSYADKVNKAASDKQYVTVADAKKALGDECFQTDLLVGGALFAIKGYKNTMTQEELEKKMEEADENTKYEAIVIGYLGSNCMKAYYVSGTWAEIEATIKNSSN